jgi:hypothetical protein
LGVSIDVAGWPNNRRENFRIKKEVKFQISGQQYGVPRVFYGVGDAAAIILDGVKIVQKK